MASTLLLASPEIWKFGHGADHPLKPERLRRTFELLDELGMLRSRNLDVIAPRLSTVDELELFHTREYIQAVQALGAGDRNIPPGRFGMGPGDNPVYPGMFEAHARAVGGALLGAERLVAGACEIAFNLAGGLHHAWKDHASGFCVFNDAAVAITWLLRQGLRVAYVDIDVHHGDGVQHAFEDTDRVLTISLHQDGRTLFPGTGFVEETGRGAGKGFTVNLPLPSRTTDETYGWAFEQIVPPLVTRFSPDLLVSQLGVDTHYLDPLADLALTTRTYEHVVRRLRGLAPRWLALGGGGYDLEVVPRAWALMLGAMAGVNLPKDLPRRYRLRYGGRRLRDVEEPSLDEVVRSRVQAIVEERVARLKTLHGLG